METNVNYTIVGIFVITLITAITLAIIWLSSGIAFQQMKTYQINMTESISGLDIDSPVDFNGVSVGSVRNIRLNHDNPRLVTLLLDVKKDTPITAGTIATLKTRGITGISFVELSDKGTDLSPLEKMSGEEYPIIKTGPSLYLKLDTALSRLSENVTEITKAINRLLDNENMQNFRELLDNLRQASKDFGPLVKSTTSTMNTLEGQTLPRTYQLLNNLDQLTRNLSQITIQVKQNPSILIRGTAGQPLGPGEK
jgi:phospholipid/cholesterol/gamma-HCH transport system substrate-binding protein